MRTVALLAVALLALAGCSSKSGPDNYTCKATGKVIDLAQVEGSGKAGFDPESACPAPLPPSVAFAAMPASMTAYFPAIAAWQVSSGNYTSGHSMLTQIRWSHHTIALDQLHKPDDYGTLAAQYAHQDLPGRFDAKLKFETPGAYFVRAYAQVRGDGLADTDYWSPEVQLTVSPVGATGKVTQVDHGVGPVGAVGKLTATQASFALGDALVLGNQDAVPHTFSFSGVCKHDPVTVPAQGGKSDPIVMVVPGSCKVATDDTGGPQTLTVNVAEPL
ncbi:MAG: hypothetical protein QOG31_853 [Thermoplasmata archaeon]|jgi:hypothetical protein|nr:hypothetical protein [Thermoplasmata archaeon]